MSPCGTHAVVIATQTCIFITRGWSGPRVRVRDCTADRKLNSRWLVCFESGRALSSYASHQSQWEKETESLLERMITKHHLTVTKPLSGRTLSLFTQLCLRTASLLPFNVSFCNGPWLPVFHRLFRSLLRVSICQFSDRPLIASHESRQRLCFEEPRGRPNRSPRCCWLVL